jgi:magnesium-transporting ATPase (P-type)
MGTGIAKARHGWLSWEWITESLVIVSLVACSRVGHWLPMAVQDAAFLIVVATPLFLTAMAWARFVNVRRDWKIPRWRFWISLCGCVALSLALVMPWIIFLFSMLRLHLFDWMRLLVWCLAASLGSLLAGIFGPKSLRFPLIFGGLIMGGLVVIIPVGIL